MPKEVSPANSANIGVICGSAQDSGLSADRGCFGLPALDAWMGKGFGLCRRFFSLFRVRPARIRILANGKRLIANGFYENLRHLWMHSVLS